MATNCYKKARGTNSIYLAKIVYETYNSSSLAQEILRFNATFEITTLIGQGELINRIIYYCNL